MENSNVLFENKTTQTAEQYRAVYAHYFFKRKSSVAVLVLILLYFLIASGYSIYRIAEEGVWDINFIIVSVIFLALLLYRPFQYYSYSKAAGIRLSEVENVPELTFAFTESGMLCDGGNIALPYSSIRRCYLIKDVIYFITAGRRLILLDRSGFTKGNDLELIEFLAKYGVSSAGK